MPMTHYLSRGTQGLLVQSIRKKGSLYIGFETVGTVLFAALPTGRVQAPA
jgi:hypothetical protein